MTRSMPLSNQSDEDRTSIARRILGNREPAAGSRHDETAAHISASGSLVPSTVRHQVHKKTELVLRIDRGHGPLKTVLDAILDRGVKILAQCSFTDWNGTTLLLVVEDDLIGRHALEATGFRYRTESVVLVETSRRVGSAAQLGQSLASAGIDIVYSYVASSENDRLVAVFKTVNDDEAVRVLAADPEPLKHRGVESLPMGVAPCGAAVG